MKGNTLLLFVASLYCFSMTISCSSSELKSDTSEFIIAPNHTIEIVASEPLVILPVSMIEDSYGRFWVVEMPGYMRDIDGQGEDIPDGRIVILSDENGDGKTDKRTIFLDSLENPRAICLAYNGLLFTDGTQLKWTSTKGDAPSNTVVVDSFYVVGGNIEHQPNVLLYNIDNWIYSAKSNARYRFSKGKWQKEATTFRGQWGMSMDEDGRLVYNHNSAPLLGDVCLPNQILNNPYLNLEHSTGQMLTDDMRIFPIQATSVNRGYLPEVLDSVGKVINYTSACAPHIFYGSNLSSKFHKSAFVCAPEANLIANYTLDNNTLNANRQLGDKEFLVSKDESFRPVNLHTGFDGSLYVVDMRKGIIQHSAYMSSYLRDKITKKGLDKINGKGRIYRIRKEYAPYASKLISNLSSKELMDMFGSNNLQHRIFAQKELIAQNDKSVIESLYRLALESSNPRSNIHALWTLEGMDALNDDMIKEVGRKTYYSDVLHHLLMLSKTVNKESEHFEDLYKRAFDVKSKKIDFILASIIGSHFEDLWFKISDRYPSDWEISESLVSSIGNRENYFLTKIKNSKKEVLEEIINQTIANKDVDDNQLPQLIQEPFDDDRTNGLKIFKTYCASCHGLDGKGQKNVAPPLKSSTIINGAEDQIASIILNGYTSENSPYKIMMPGYRDDKKLTDQDIYDIISYLKSTYTSEWNSIKVEEIKAIRSVTSN